MLKKEIIEYLRKYKSDNEVFHDLMPCRIREILLIASIYDAFTLEEDGLISERIFAEFYQLNLFQFPRITSASSGEEGLERLRERKFDLVIIISPVCRRDHRILSKKIKTLDPDVPIYLLVNDNAGIGEVSKNLDLFNFFDNIFVWNGNSEIFLAIVKLAEDRLNVFNDTQIGMVRVILLVEDSIRYYSRYLPVLYQEIMKQTSRLVSEEQLDAKKKVLRRRARPKVLLASNFEEAVDLADLYKDYLLCVISDVTFPVDGKINDFAGIKLAKRLRDNNADLPILFQTSQDEFRHTANAMGVHFISKDSDNLIANLTRFFFEQLGFGDFVFRDETRREMGRARNMQELKERLSAVPVSSIVYHASRNHFSAWLMARGEVQISKVVLKTKVGDYPNPEDLRHYLINVGESIKALRIKGKVIPFDKNSLNDRNHIFRLADGSLGGKGRGIAFLNSLLSNSDLATRVPQVDIKIPLTSVVGIDEYTAFIERNRLSDIIHGAVDYDVCKRRFLLGSLSPGFQERLLKYLESVEFPIAVRSSGLLEDALSHPLSGVYQTYFLPNNHPDIQVRLSQLMEAIRLVYASICSKSAFSYLEAINFKVEEERMGVIIQEVVGEKFGNRFYPHVSGVAQSYNYYPFSYIKPEDGVATIALGLGKYVVGGEASYRFCPTYPDLDLVSPEEQMKGTQRRFYALDLSHSMVDLFKGEDATLLTLDIDEAEKDGVIGLLASTFDLDDQCLRPGISRKGPRILNFPFLVKYPQVPLPKILREILEVMSESMESPVEVEFALNLNPGASEKPTFYVLQVKHLGQEAEDGNVNIEEIEQNKPSVFLFSTKGVGNGLVKGVSDIVWVDPKTFDKSRTREMVAEIENLNSTLRKADCQYVLLGPGRWGTRDQWLGIPITWPQISQARVIVEYELVEFPVDASLGSHFFHNITSMNVGYFSVPGSSPNFIDWDWLRAQNVVSRTKHFVHSRSSVPMKITMDGRHAMAVIFKQA